jgi:hypothetical protein
MKMSQKYQCKNNWKQGIFPLLLLLMTACTPDTFGSKIAVTRVIEIIPTSTRTIEITGLPLTTTPTVTLQSLPTTTSIVSATSTFVTTPTEIIPIPTNVFTTSNEVALIQISSVPGAISWESEDRLKVALDFHRDSETLCTTKSWQVFNITYPDKIIEVLPPSISEATSCPEPKPILSDASLSALPGAVVGQEVSSDRTYSLLFVEVLSSTLPLLGKTTDLDLGANPSLVEGWVIKHETGDLYPIFATQLGYAYSFLPGNHHIVVQSDCYGANLGSGLHIINIENRSLLTLAEYYGGLCEGAFGLAISPDSQYLIHSKGTVVSVDGELKGQLCTEEQFPRSWAWSSNSQRVYGDCDQDKQDFIWQYDIETGRKVLLNDLIIPPVSLKARAMAVSPDEKWLAFTWGASDFFEQDEYGVWLLRLDQDNE